MKTLSTRTRRILILAACLAATVGSAGETDKAASDALKQVSRAIEKVVGIQAEVEYSEIVWDKPIKGTGTIFVRFDGRARLEIGGESPRSVLLIPPYLYIHTHAEERVELFDLTFNPNRLGQYVMLGFAPAGSELKKKYGVVLTGGDALDGSPAISFLLTPKSKEVAAAIARIQLWVDPTSGLPLRQEVVHALADTKLQVRYLNMTLRDDLDPELFLPNWPEGTEVDQRS